MHINKYNFFTYIDNLNQEEILKLERSVHLILRNYKKKFKDEELRNLIKFCKKDKRKIFLWNDFKRAKKLNFNGVYVPSFNKLPLKYKIGIKKEFEILGSAHNIREVIVKINQKIDIIFISPLFKKNKRNILGVVKFNLIKKDFKKEIIALGGINNINKKLLKMVNVYGYAGIRYFKKI